MQGLYDQVVENSTGFKGRSPLVGRGYAVPLYNSPPSFVSEWGQRRDACPKKIVSYTIIYSIQCVRCVKSRRAVLKRDGGYVHGHNIAAGCLVAHIGKNSMGFSKTINPGLRKFVPEKVSYNCTKSSFSHVKSDENVIVAHKNY